MEIISAFLFFLIMIMTALGAFAGLFFKKASGNLSLKALVVNYNLYLGVLLYLIAAIINIIVLKFLDYSLVLPLTSLTYVWTMVVSCFILKEKIGLTKIAGVLLIVLGAVLLSIF